MSDVAVCSDGPLNALQLYVTLDCHAFMHQ